jgi:hypothetical protein
MRSSDFYARTAGERKLLAKALFKHLTEGGDMASGTIYRVWYGKRWGVPQSFKDGGDFYGAANFATLSVADRIEFIR